MSTPVVCVTAETTPGEALRAMVRAGVRHLVVIDAGGRCVGVLADRALAAMWAHDPDALSRGRVATMVDPEPALVAENARVDAARLMRAAGVDAVAVVDESGHPIGILTGTDLIALLARSSWRSPEVRVPSPTPATSATR